MRGVVLCALAGLSMAASSALAHEVREAEPEVYDIEWRVPARGDLRLDVRLPEGCHDLSQPRRSLVSSMYVDRWRVRCAGGLDGRRIDVEGLASTMTDVVARVVRADGRTQTAQVIPSDPFLLVEATPGRLQGAITYLTMGLKHILLGADHLLFVLGLMLIVHDRWMLLKTITSFTLAHSVTLAIATLGYARAPTDPLNAAIGSPSFSSAPRSCVAGAAGPASRSAIPGSWPSPSGCSMASASPAG